MIASFAILLRSLLKNTKTQSSQRLRKARKEVNDSVLCETLAFLALKYKNTVLAKITQSAQYVNKTKWIKVRKLKLTKPEVVSS